MMDLLGARQPFKIIAYVYETPKAHPIAAVLENGICLDIDPWDTQWIYGLNYEAGDRWAQ
jgi:hypothetical protein